MQAVQQVMAGLGVDLKDCCARKILAAEQDFHEQRGRLQEEIEACGHKVIFYPKFHCELNPIEPYWCKAKWYTREYCDYSLEGLRQSFSLSRTEDSLWIFQPFYAHY